MVIGSSFVAALTALGVAQWTLDRAVGAQATVQAPRFEVDPLWPKPLPNNWVLGETIGVGIDAQDHVWIVHRADTRERASKARPTRSRRRRRAAAGRRRCSSSIRPATSSATGAVPATGYEWPASNHGIFVDYKDNVWIGGNDAKDAHILKFTKSGKFLMQFGAPGTEQRQQRHGELRPRREDLRRSEGQRGLHRRRLRQQARRRHRRGQREVQAVLGRVRQQAGRHGHRPLRSECAAGAAVPHAGALRRAVRTTASSTSAIGRTTASRCSARTARS